jgi:hypothetical protein
MRIFQVVVDGVSGVEGEGLRDWWSEGVAVGAGIDERSLDMYWVCLVLREKVCVA